MTQQNEGDDLLHLLADSAAACFLRYVCIDTRSERNAEAYPSTDGQLDLLRLLRDELNELNVADATIDAHGYVTATIPSTVEWPVPTIAFFAHVDTTPDLSGKDVKPNRFRYTGGSIRLGSSGVTLTLSDSPALANHVGHQLITTDGTTVLGADDKAGVAEIMAAATYLMAHPEVPHGVIKLVFNPDEEVGRGVTYLPVESLQAFAGYTVDGLDVGEINAETFSAAEVTMRIRGRAIHPGWAKSELVNAIKLAGRILDQLPTDRLSPETTSGRDGYVHPVEIHGNATETELSFYVRDFENDLLDQHVALLQSLADALLAQEPRCSIEIDVEHSYKNMRTALAERPEIVANLEESIRRVGLEPRHEPLRGGTDGSFLTERGLPTPNLFTGGHNPHSEREWICVQDMGVTAATIVELAKVWASKSRGSSERALTSKGNGPAPCPT